MPTKKVLIIGYFFPYIRGSGRVSSLVKYLPEYGWEPLVLTAPLPKDRRPTEVRLIETEGYTPDENTIGTRVKKSGIASNKAYMLAKPAISFLYRLYLSFANYPDSETQWRKYALKAAEKTIGEEKIDAMVSIWPVTGHLVAKELKLKHRIPWIADYPDPWSQNHNYPYPFRRAIDRRLEIKTIKPADAITTVTLPWAKNLEKLHDKKEVSVISHGFDPRLVNDPPAKLTQKFTITYTGSIYPEKQDIKKVLEALEEMMDEGTIDPADTEVRFYGHSHLLQEGLKDGLTNQNLKNMIKEYDRMPREAVSEKQRESHVLLLLNWEDPAEKGVCPLKTFDYLAARRPIIATGGYGGDPVEKIFAETGAGAYCKTVEEIKAALSGMYAEYKEKGTVSYRGDAKKLDEYSARSMAKKFAEILEGLARGGRLDE